MNRRLVFLGLAGVFLLCGCGGSSKRSSNYAPGTTSNSTVTSGATPSTTPSVTTAQGPPPTTTPTTPPPGVQNVRIPATFTIRAGGVLSPRNVFAPAFLAIQLTVSSSDARAHQIAVLVPQRTVLSVPAHGRASARIRGLRQGNYVIEVDGVRRGALEIGGEPGP